MDEPDKSTNALIPHDTVVDLLRITMLVYNYGKSFTVDNENETVESFVNKMTKDGSIETVGLTDVRKEALIDIAAHAPTGKVCKFISDEETDVQVGITVNDDDKRICIVFRGSESKKDWYYDLQIFKHNLIDNVWVHSGFYKQLHENGVYNQVLSEVKLLVETYPDYSVYVTGHSLGAALATLCGYSLSCEIENQVTIVSFASPRVGNAEWKNVFDKQKNLTHYRVTNDRDIVTAFPMYKYYHVGKTVRLFEDSYSIIVDDSQLHWYDFTLFQCWRAGDHDCDLYYKRLLQHKWSC
jgi:predicted lipase